jgi:uncharacterized protein with FMN-binding domain
MHRTKPIAALALTGIGSALVIGFQVPAPAAATQAVATTAATATPTGAASTTTATTGTASASPSTATGGGAATATPAGSTTTAAVAATATYADGTYTGTAVTEPWGAFQVQAVVSGGVLTNVILVTSPSDGHSSGINSRAVPALTQAAIAADGASIDLVSGATWTSRSYITSLQGALDQARAVAEAAAAAVA